MSTTLVYTNEEIHETLAKFKVNGWAALTQWEIDLMKAAFRAKKEQEEARAAIDAALDGITIEDDDAIQPQQEPQLVETPAAVEEAVMNQEQPSEKPQAPVEATTPAVDVGENENAPQSQSEAVEAEEPSGFHVDLPGSSDREWLEEQEAKLKEEIDTAKDALKLCRRSRSSCKSEETKKKFDAKIADLEAAKEEKEKELRGLQRVLLSLPPAVIPDENQPWFGRVYANCTGYIIKSSDGTFKQVNKDVAATYLRGLGISPRPDTQTTSPLDRSILAIHDRHSVDWAGALAGYKPGMVRMGSNKVLITKGPNLLEPSPDGDFPTIREFLTGMLGEDQMDYVYGWLKLAVDPLYGGQVKKGQALILAGPINTGKSVFQNLIVTPLLGGRVARPYAYMVKRTDFNEDWFESEHLMLEDEAPPRDYETRQLVAGEIKNLIANDVQWCHGKGKKAIPLPPFWRLTVSVNDNPESLGLIPVNDETLKDKIIILRTYADATVNLVKSMGGQDNFAEAIKNERPAFLHWLMNTYQIAADLRDTRFGMKAYQNPDIVETAEETAPHIHLLDTLRKKVYAGGAAGKKKTVSEIFQDLHAANIPKGIAPATPNTLGKYLSSIVEMGTGEIKRERTKKGTVYVLNFPEIKATGVTTFNFDDE